jgi:hypothetical protein
VSVWRTLEDARPMETLAPMLALAGEFVALGVTFERPITNHDGCGSIASGLDVKRIDHLTNFSAGRGLGSGLGGAAFS